MACYSFPSFDDDLEKDLSNSLEHSGAEGVLVQGFSGTRSLNVPREEVRVALEELLLLLAADESVLSRFSSPNARLQLLGEASFAARRYSRVLSLWLETRSKHVVDHPGNLPPLIS